MAGPAGHWRLKGFGHWVLEERESGALVGRAGLLFPPDWPALELGWTVARPRCGYGSASEAARAAAAWAQEELGADHLISLIASGDATTRRVAEPTACSAAGKAVVGSAHPQPSHAVRPVRRHTDLYVYMPVNCPPVTFSTCPCTKFDHGEHRKNTPPAASSGVAARPSGVTVSLPSRALVGDAELELYRRAESSPSPPWPPSGASRRSRTRSR